METDISGGVSFQDIDLESSQSQFGKYLDTICPYYIHYGMTYNEFWFGSLDRLHDYWQANEFGKERKNWELWMQGAYIKMAIVSAFDTKGTSNYPSKPYRITEMTEIEREADNKLRIEQLKETLNAHKQNWDIRHNDKGAGMNGNR